MNLRIIKGLLLTLILGLSLTLLYWGYIFKQSINAPLVIGEKPLIFEVHQNETSHSIINRFFRAHYIQNKWPLKFYIRYYHIAKNLKAGIYEIKQGETAPYFLDRVMKGDVLKLNIRIPEGARLSDLVSIFKSSPYLKFNPQDFNLIQGTHQSAEGLMLADTYQYNAGSEAQAIIDLAHHHLDTFLQLMWKQRASNLPYQNAYEMLVAASIIEKESGQASERKLISGVIVNRLHKGMPLQMDPTVIYGLGEHYTGKLHHDDMSYPSPYNTYKNKGLPPTPIAMVGKEAIIAAALPTPTTYLYFVAKGDGTHEFSSTYEEQRRAIYKYHHQGMKH